MPEDNQDNLVLERLREIRANQDDMKTALAEHSEQLSDIRRGIAAIRRDQAADAESVVLQTDRIDRITSRVHRIERRLQLRENDDA